MKNKKQKFLDYLLDGVVELILTVLFFGIGFLIVKLFCKESAVDNVDFDLTILVGIIVFLVVFVTAYLFVKLIKKILKSLNALAMHTKQK